MGTLEHLGTTPLNQKPPKNSKKSTFIDYILLESYNATNHDFSVLIPKNNQFKLHLQESLLIKRDKPELNRNICIYPLELFA